MTSEDAGYNFHVPGPFSGRANAVAVSPTDPDTAFIGASEGGVWRTTDGGATWSPIADDMNTLGVSSLALLADGTLWIGSGGDYMAGDGLYRIRDAIATPANELELEGPFATRVAGSGTESGNGVALAGNSIVAIAADPLDPDRLYVAAADRHFAVFKFPYGPPRGTPGLYRTTNATADEPRFNRVPLAGDSPHTWIGDVRYLPESSDELLVTLLSPPISAGVYRTAEAGADAPSFDRVLPLQPNSSSGPRANIGASNDTVYISSNESVGTLFKSTDRGLTFARGVASPGAGEFDTNAIAWGVGSHTGGIAVDPTDPDNVMLGGAFHSGRFRIVLASSDGGTTFATASGPQIGNLESVHPDITAIAFAPSDPDVAWLTSDGGVYRTGNARSTPEAASGRSPVSWTPRNSPELNTLQLYNLDVHPEDPEITVAGTQDNAAVINDPSGGHDWEAFAGGDVFTALIDDSGIGTDDFDFYGQCLRFQSSAGDLRFDAALSFFCQFRPWSMLGPGRPNPWYHGIGFGPIFRSDDRGATVRSVFGAASALAISRADDDVRLFGTRDGGLFRSARERAADEDIAGPWPRGYLEPEFQQFPWAVIQAITFDPTDDDTAYVGLGGFMSRYEGEAVKSHVWRTRNLSAANPTWEPVGEGLPDMPIWSLVIDPNNPGRLFAGTDSGVFASEDAGQSWSPFGRGLPRGCDVPPGTSCPPKILLMTELSMEVVPHDRPQPSLRIATNSRGVWEADLARTCDGQAATIVGTDGHDTLHGTRGDDVVVDLVGGATIDTGRGKDLVCTGTADDEIDTGPGDDRVFAGSGGNDVGTGPGDDLVVAIGPGVDGSSVQTGPGADTVRTGPGGDAIDAGPDADRVRSGGGADGVIGGSGDDHLDTGSGDDRVRAEAGDDFVAADEGNNVIDLGKGDDRSVAGAGDDEIDGGTGEDECDLGEGTNAVARCEVVASDWQIDGDPPGRPGDPALFVASVTDRDAAIAREFVVDDPQLRFVARWNLEPGYDIAAVQVSTDGGASYRSVACTATATTLNSDSVPSIRELLPAFTGASDGFEAQECDLSDYVDAGQRVLLALRLAADFIGGGESDDVQPGFWIDDLRLGDRELSDGSSLAGWMPTNVREIEE